MEEGGESFHFFLSHFRNKKGKGWLFIFEKRRGKGWLLDKRGKFFGGGFLLFFSIARPSLDDGGGPIVSSQILVNILV